MVFSHHCWPANDLPLSFASLPKEDKLSFVAPRVAGCVCQLQRGTLPTFLRSNKGDSKRLLSQCRIQGWVSYTFVKPLPAIYTWSKDMRNHHSPPNPWNCFCFKPKEHPLFWNLIKFLFELLEHSQNSLFHPWNLTELLRAAMHPRNKHRDYLDYRELAQRQTALQRYVFENQWGGASIDYSNPEALEELTRSLLAEFYDIQNWRLPKGYLCPPVPQRADYIHVICDLLQKSTGDVEPRGPSICGLDIGTGASCIYSLLGAREYGWSFIASDIDETALSNAEELVRENGLAEQITVRRQQDPKRVLRGVLLPDEVVAFSVCNPPFHESLEHAQQAAASKWQRLGKELKDKNYQAGCLARFCFVQVEVSWSLCNAIVRFEFFPSLFTIPWKLDTSSSDSVWPLSGARGRALLRGRWSRLRHKAHGRECQGTFGASDVFNSSKCH